MGLKEFSQYPKTEKSRVGHRLLSPPLPVGHVIRETRRNKTDIEFRIIIISYRVPSHFTRNHSDFRFRPRQPISRGYTSLTPQNVASTQLNLVPVNFTTVYVTLLLSLVLSKRTIPRV